MSLQEFLDERISHARGRAMIKAGEARHATHDVRAQSDAEQALSDLKHYVDLRSDLDQFVSAGDPYRPGTPWNPLSDLAKERNDRSAADRIGRHDRVVSAELRSTTGAFGGLVISNYNTPTSVGLHPTDPLVRTLARQLPPDGMQFMLPTVANPAAAESQNGEGAAITGTTPATTAATVTVKEWALSFNADYQVLERGRQAADWLLDEARAAFNGYAEQQVINGAGTSGTVTGILNTGSIATQAVTTTTTAGFLTALATAVRTSTAARGLAPDVVAMHPRRWAWLLAGSSQPAVSTQTLPYGPELAVGQVLGIPVISSAGIPTTLGTSTNEDAVLVVRRDDVWLATSPLQVSLEKQRTGTATTALMSTFRLKQDVVLDCTRWAGATVKMTGTGLV